MLWCWVLWFFWFSVFCAIIRVGGLFFSLFFTTYLSTYFYYLKLKKNQPLFFKNHSSLFSKPFAYIKSNGFGPNFYHSFSIPFFFLCRISLKIKVEYILLSSIVVIVFVVFLLSFFFFFFRVFPASISWRFFTGV